MTEKRDMKIRKQHDNTSCGRTHIPPSVSLVEEHYHSDNLTGKIKKALAGAGKELSDLETKDLAGVDQLHTGGAKATIELINRTGLVPDAEVLDAGCGTGGSSRLLAEKFKARVTGIDLSWQFIRTAKFLTRCTKLEDRVCFHQGSVLCLPFEDQSFDAVLCQHMLMNIQDKHTAIKEFYRVLKPGGKLIIHEITRGTGKEPVFPVPWAGEPDISFLEPWQKISSIISRCGFMAGFHENRTGFALEWWEKAASAASRNPPAPDRMGPGIVFGENAQFFAVNMRHNFQENSICLVEAVFKKSYD